MINAELKKYCWLELSWTRLAVLVMVLGVLFYIGRGLDIHLLFTNPLTCFFILVGFWGTRQVAQAMPGELSQHTWDRQRMSAIGAWTFVWSKTIGPAIYTWIGGIICLLTYLAFHLNQFPEAVITIVALFMAGLAGQLLALFLNLQSMQITRQVSRTQNFGYFVLGVLLSGGLAYQIMYGYVHGLQWYSCILSQAAQQLMLVIFILFWVSIGAYRLMRLELQHVNTLSVWILFVISSVLFLSGFVSEIYVYQYYPKLHQISTSITSNLNMCILSSLFFVVMLTYITVFFEAKTNFHWRRLYRAWQHREMKKVWSFLPLWLPLYIICWIMGATLVALTHVYIIFCIVSVVLLFLLRDIILFVVMHIASDNPHRTDWAVLFYLIFSYAIIGGVLLHMHQQSFAMLFVPIVNDQHLFIQPGIIIIEIVLFMFWGYRRWHHFHKNY